MFFQILMVLCIFFSCYLYVRKINSIKIKKRILKTKIQTANVSKVTYLANIKSKLYYTKLFQRKEAELYKLGNPFKLNSFKYYAIKSTFSILLFILAAKNYNNFLISIVFSLSGFLFLDIYLVFYKKSRELKICSDLFNITNQIYLSLSANISLRDSVRRSYELCKNQEFKKVMLIFCSSLDYSNLDINNATNELEKRFDISYIEVFCLILKQSSKTNDILEMLRNLSKSLKIKNVENLKQSTINKIIYITFGVIVAFVNIILITFYPMFVSISANFQTLFS